MRVVPAALRRPTLLLMFVAIVAMLPVLLGPVRTNDSHWIDIVWADQFTAQLRAGVLWPRWLPQSHGGLGAPTFLFYGPVAFWLAGVFGLLGASAWPSLVLAACTALAASGCAMHLYLTGRSGRPLAGAIAYMLLPYHLLDFAQRGAIAEFAAYAWLPLVALGISHAAKRRPALLAGAYAGLILTHLPTAVLVSVLLVPLLAWLDARRDPAKWQAVGGGLAAGLGLAAAYLVPALSLQGATAMASMRALPHLQPAIWWIGNIRYDEAGGILLIHTVASAATLFALLAIWRDRREPWGWAVLATALLALGAMPPLWRLPALDHVQFPWRILVLAEFGIALLIARTSLAPVQIAWAGLPLMVISMLIALPAAQAPRAGEVATLLRIHPDVIEYLPRGVGEPVAIYSPWALSLAQTTLAERFDGRFTTLHRFASPIWRVRCDARIVPSGPAPNTGLLRYAGRGCAIERAVTPAERVGWTITLATLALAGVALLRRRIGAVPTLRLLPG